MRRILLNCIVVVGLFLIAGCKGECRTKCDKDGKHCKSDCGEGSLECVDGDDWGYPKIFVPANTEGIIEAYGGSISPLDMQAVVGTRDQYAPNFDEYFKAKDDYILTLVSRNGVISGSYPDQSVAAIDSGQLVMDDRVPLVITTGKRDQWTSWFGGEANHSPSFPDGDLAAWDGGKGVPNRECQYKVTNGIAPTVADAPTEYVFPLDLSPSVLWQNHEDTSDMYYLDDNYNYRSFVVGDDPNDSNNPPARAIVYRKDFANGLTPCQFRYGMGLYVGFAPSDELGEISYRNVLATYHIPDSKRPGTSADDFVTAPTSGGGGSTIVGDDESNIKNAHNLARGMDGYLVRGLPVDEFSPGNIGGSRLYFKIVDRYYNDNEGGYSVKIKEGTKNISEGPVVKVVRFFTDTVSVIMRRVYEGIVSHSDYLTIVRNLLVLYIVVYGYKLMIARNSQEDLRKDAVIRMFKVGVVGALISPGSWEFFYNHVFHIFLVGVQSLAGMLLNPWGDYVPDPTLGYAAPWQPIDLVLAKLFSRETGAKISSTLFSNFPLGIIFIIFLYLAIILFLVAVIKAVIVYIIAFISIAILIALAPIFLIFMLFDVTKRLLEEWWGQLIGFSVQQVILIVALGMFATIIVMYLERTLGYRVCWNTYADFDFIGVNKDLPASVHLFGLKFWMPDIGTSLTNIWMDVDGNGIRESLPVPEMAYRYEDLPYFDPIIDKKIIARYMRLKDFLSFTDFLIFILAIFLMQSFIKFVPQMVEGLKGGSPADTSSVFSAAKGLHFAIVRGFKDTAHEAWNIGKSLNTRRIIDSGESVESRMRKGVGGLRDGVGGLRDGVGGLRAGVRGPRDGVGGLRDGVGGLRDGVGGLRDGVGGLRDGVGGLRDGVDQGEDISIRLRKGLNTDIRAGVDQGDDFSDRLRKDVNQEEGGFKLRPDSDKQARDNINITGVSSSDNVASSSEKIKKQAKNLLDEVGLFGSGGVRLNLSTTQVNIVKQIVESDNFNTLPSDLRNALLKLLRK